MFLILRHDYKSKILRVSAHRIIRGSYSQLFTVVYMCMHVCYIKLWFKCYLKENETNIFTNK